MPARRHTWILFNLTLIAAGSNLPVCATEWLPLTPEELQLTREPKAPGAAAIYLYRQVERNDNYPDETYYQRLKILTEAGRKYANIEIPYVKGLERIHDIEARTIHSDGSIVRFDGTVYEKPIVSTRGEKLIAKTFTMPDVEAGSIIEYRYTHALERGYVFDSHWILSQELFTRSAKFSLVPSQYFTLQWSWPCGLPEGTDKPKNDRGKIRLETHDVPAFVTEELMPPANELKYRVDFTYLEPGDRADKDPVVYWKWYGKKSFRSAEKFVDRKKAMAQAVAQIAQLTEPPETRMRKIYARVQQLRNTTFEPDKSDEELKRAHESAAKNVEEVWSRGAGNASDLTYLFLALARAAGLHADLALVATRDRYIFNSRAMDSHQLNSNIVIVDVDGRDWFLDPGIPFTPFGLLPWTETAVQAMRLDEEGGKWLPTPLPAPSASRVERSAHLKLDPDGTLDGTLTLRYTGLEASWRRLEERNEDDTDRKLFLESELKGTVPAGIEPKLTNSPDWRGSDEPLIAQFSLTIPGWAAAAGQRRLLRVGLFGGEDDRTFQHFTRVQPMVFDFPYQHSDDVLIEMPAGLKVSSLPKPRNVDLKTVSYGSSAEIRDGLLHLKRDISLNLLFLKVDAYPQIQDFFQSVRTGDEEQVVISAAAAIAQR